ncbi:MAG: phosphodiester glycosidase family protein [Clostridia bacterium]|nr:phosphodiester glycosidase family protein [Clostridia bacterium]
MAKEKKKHPVLKGIGIFFLFLLTTLVILGATLYLAMRDICDTAVSTRNTLITTLLETGQMKFIASLLLSDEEIEEVVRSNSMETVPSGNVNEDLIVIGATVGDKEYSGEGSSVSPSHVGTADKEPDEEKDIEIVQIAGLTFHGTLMIIKDPSRVSLSTIYDPVSGWPDEGIPLKSIVEADGALGGINGGLYHSTNNTGGWPTGICVSRGEILRNRPREASGLYLIGLTDKNILQIIDVSGMTAAESEKMIREMGIRDAVCFQEAAKKDNNHFVTLVLNGEPRSLSGTGSGLNPRTAIGQRADGALLLLVTDGRGYNNHVGASAADLVDIMMRYGAVNAANLDGGSSTCMYYDGEYLQNSVTFFYSKTSWRLPVAFVIH